MPLYAEAFEDAGALDRLEGFASVHGAAFYGLPRNGDTITLVRGAVDRCRDDATRSAQRRIVPLRAGETLRVAGRLTARCERWPAYNGPAKPARPSLPRE